MAAWVEFEEKYGIGAPRPAFSGSAGVAPSFLTPVLKAAPSKAGEIAAQFEKCLSEHAGGHGAAADDNKKAASQLEKLRHEASLPEKTDAGVAQVVRYYVALEQLERKLGDKISVRLPWRCSFATGKSGSYFVVCFSLWCQYALCFHCPFALLLSDVRPQRSLFRFRWSAAASCSTSAPF